MKYLLENMQVLEKYLKRALLLLDYDGTLTPIVERPELAKLSPDMRRILKSLAKSHKVVIVSGRSLTDIKKLVGLNGVYYVGNHGIEISGPKMRFVQPMALRMRPTMAQLCKKLQRELREIKGAIVQSKELTVSVHYRLVSPEKLKLLKSIVGRITKPYSDAGSIKFIKGKKIIDIVPNINWNKGKASLWIISILDPKGNTLPIYIGDDKTDEDAFLVMKKIGPTVLVTDRRKKSFAKFYLKNVGDVKTFLEKLI